MLLSKFKSINELTFTLKNKKKIGIFSCGTCSNLCDTGGSVGIKAAKNLLNDLNKEIVFSQVVTALCPTSITREASRKKRKKIDNCDAILVLSCSSGVKALKIENPNSNIIAFSDSTGSAVVTDKVDLVSSSVCLSCGKCVISFTDGICPYSKCEIKAKYEPCKKFIEGNPICQIDKTKKCIWFEIIKRVDISPLKELEKIHKETTGVYPTKYNRNIHKSIVKTTALIAFHFKFFHLYVRRLVKKINIF